MICVICEICVQRLPSCSSCPKNSPESTVDCRQSTVDSRLCCDKTPISGAQDAIGIVYPGLARSDYRGEYWPYHVEHRTDEQLLRFVEDVLYLIPLGPRRDGYDVLSDTRIDLAGAQVLAEATELCWQAILAQDAVEFGLGVRRSFEAQIAMFPHMANPTIAGLIERYRDAALGWKVSGAGGGGYLIVVSEQGVESGLRVRAR